MNTQKNARKGKDYVVLQVLFTHTQYVYFTEYAYSIRVHSKLYHTVYYTGYIAYIHTLIDKHAICTTAACTTCRTYP